MLKSIYLIALLFIPFLAISQPGANDTTFNVVDNGTLGGGFNSDVNVTCIQPDGKIIVGGGFTSYKGTSCNRIVRLNQDGSIDNSFTIGTAFDAGVNSIALQTDGKIVVGGNFLNYNGTSAGNIIRLNTDGSVDGLFNLNSGTGFSAGSFGSKVLTISLQTNGKIVVGGLFITYNSSNAAFLTRLNSNGTIDATYNTSGAIFSTAVYTTAIQADGKILAGGDFITYNGIAKKYIIRLNSDGTNDATFNAGSNCNGKVRSLDVQSDGKIIIVGYFTSYAGTTRNRIARLNTDASLDLTFDPGTAFNNWVSTVKLRPDGKMLVGGPFSTFNTVARRGIALLNTDGSLDLNYNPILPNIALAWSIDVQADGKMILGGSFTSVNGVDSFRIVRTESDGAVDYSFNPLNGANHIIYTTSVQNDGKIIIGGEFNSFNATSQNRIARLMVDGSIDPTFNTSSGFNLPVRSTSIQTDGKIIVGGDFTLFNGASANKIVRLNSDGTIDNSFNSGTGFIGSVQSTVIQSDGKIVVGGSFTSYNGTSVNRIIRLNSDGSIDPSFISGSGLNGTVYAIAIQPDNKIIIGGNFTTYDGTTRNKIGRLNADGTLDLTFNSNAGYTNSIFTLDIQTNGKIIIGGDFINSSTTRVFLSRVNTNGTEDFTFAPAMPSSVVYAVKIQNTGKIVVGGLFDTPNAGGPGRKRIMRVNANGSLDLVFHPGDGFNTGSVNSISFQPDGKIIAAGNFDSISGVPRSNIARLISDCPVILPNATITNVSCFSGNNGSLDLSPSGGFGTYTYNWGLGIISEDRMNLSAGNYTVTITDNVGCTSTAIISVSQPTSALIGSTQQTHVTCFGDSTGQINLTPNGGTSPYLYAWNDGFSGEDRSNIPSGSYSVLITDQLGCTTTVNSTLNQPLQPLSVSSVHANVSCFAGENGTIDLTISGGTLPYSFDWGNGVLLEDRTNLLEGTYSVSIIDANSCTANDTVVIIQPLSPITAAIDVSHVNCYGDTSGTIDLTINGGTMPYSFDWGNGDYSEDRINLSAGSYQVSVTDANGCGLVLDTIIDQPLAIETVLTATACASYDWFGNNYTTSGTYLTELSAMNGCDSTIILELTINNATTNSLTIEACEEYTMNNQTYFTSGIYQQLFTNSIGCDSTITINLTISQSLPITITDNFNGSLSSSVADSYQWMDCSTGNILVGSTNQTFVATQNGSYAVIGTSGSCSDTSNCIVMNDVGQLEETILNLSIHPNPTADKVFLIFDGSIGQLTIMDIQGKTLNIQEIHSGESVSLDQYSTGVYLFEVQTKIGSGFKRIVKN